MRVCLFTVHITVNLEVFINRFLLNVSYDKIKCLCILLQENYGEFALFFHDTYGGDIIGVLFKPSVYETRDFKVLKLISYKISF